MNFKRRFYNDYYNVQENEEEEEENEEEKRTFFAINAILIVFIFFSFMINLMLILIHSKQKALRKGFFIIIFIQIILESIINLSILLMNILYLINLERGKWFLSFPALFNFAYITNILYNILIMVYLMCSNKEKDELIDYNSKKENNEDNNSSSRRSSVNFISYSFNSFHIICFLFSMVHTIIYILKLIEEDIEGRGWEWYFYFMSGSYGECNKSSAKNSQFAFYIFHFIFFIVSLIYLVLSFNKEKISERFLLKRFSIYCIYSSLISLTIPISLLIYAIKGKEIENVYFIIMISFILYLLVTWIFRVKCYYIQFILESNGESFWEKAVSGFNIIFCCAKIPSPNFVDLNSTYIYHSLANFDDFIQELSSDASEKDET